MPIYAYKCESCGHSKDVLQKMSDPLLTDCPACGAPTFRKQLTAAGFQLKGSGWYATDFRNGNAKPPASGGDGESKTAEAGPVEGKTGAGTSGDGKPADGKTAESKPAESKAGEGKPAESKTPAKAPAAPAAGGGASGTQ